MRRTKKKIQRPVWKVMNTQVTEQLADDVDRVWRAAGFENRSDFIKGLLKKAVAEHDATGADGLSLSVD